VCFADYDWDEQNQRLTCVKKLLPSVEILFLNTGTETLIQEYLENSSDATATKVRRSLKGKRYLFADVQDPPPQELVLESATESKGFGSKCFDALLRGGRDEDLRLVAARMLWLARSRQYAKDVVDFAERLAPTSDAARELKTLVTVDVAPQTIAANLAEKMDLNWWAWLAAIRPHPSLVPALVQLAQDKDQLPEVLYALGQSKDSRTLPPLLNVLSESENRTARRIAANAIGEIGDSTAEPGLLKALQREDSLTRSAACDALAKVGTVRSLPALHRLFTDKSDADGFNVAGTARRAVEAIKWRLRVKETP
jgi:HEAT repeat protein